MTTATATRPTTRKGGAIHSDVRAWAVENNVAVGARGRLPASVVVAFKKATRRKLAF